MADSPPATGERPSTVSVAHATRTTAEAGDACASPATAGARPATTAGPRSWAALLKEREGERSSPAAVSVSAPVYRHTRLRSSAWRLVDSLYDPVTQKYNDPKVESSEQLRETQNRTRMLNESRDRSLRIQSGYNIITTEDLRRGLNKSEEQRKAESVERMPFQVTSSVDYNILNHTKYCETFPAEPLLRPAPRPEVEARRDGFIPMRRIPRSKFHDRIDYNIVSNRYFSKHEQRVEEESRTAQLDVDERINQHKVFNPVVGRYYDPDRDQKISSKLDEEHRLLETRRLDALPHGMKKAEGRLYNTVNFQVLDSEGLKKMEDHQNLSRMRHRTAEAKFRSYVKQQEVETMSKTERVGKKKFGATGNGALPELKPEPSIFDVAQRTQRIATEMLKPGSLTRGSGSKTAPSGLRRSGSNVLSSASLTLGSTVELPRMRRHAREGRQLKSVAKRKEVDSVPYRFTDPMTTSLSELNRAVVRTGGFQAYSKKGSIGELIVQDM